MSEYMCSPIVPGQMMQSRSQYLSAELPALFGIAEAEYSPINTVSDLEVPHASMRTDHEMQESEASTWETFNSKQREQGRFIAWCFDNMLICIHWSFFFPTIDEFRERLTGICEDARISFTCSDETDSHVRDVCRYMNARWQAVWASKDIASLYLHLWRLRESKGARSGGVQSNAEDDFLKLPFCNEHQTELEAKPDAGYIRHFFPSAVLDSLRRSALYGNRDPSNPVVLLTQIRERNLWSLLEEELAKMQFKNPRGRQKNRVDRARQGTQGKQETDEGDSDDHDDHEDREDHGNSDGPILKCKGAC